jgi:hypothetical protein
MKTKLAGLLVVIAFFGTLGSAQAVERNFGAGSLIIPMDQFYQPGADGGILEAYGLAYYLLAHTNAAGEHDITVYWIINQNKTTIDGVDFVIEDLTLVSPQVVANKYNHAGGTSALTFKTGDNYRRISYVGAPWIVDAKDAAKAKAIIDQSGWAAVDVHVAQVPFKAPVYRELKGTPPKIALMNSNESLTGGNARILESYLRLAGICNDVYEVVTPNQIRDGILMERGYDFLWAPHWHGNSADGNGNGQPDEKDIVDQIGIFLQAGKGLLAECACIGIFEQYGRFLTTLDIDTNGGTNKAADMIYNDKISAFPQTGDFLYCPTGGAIHNWKPITTPAQYNATVTRFTIDNTGWDYYVGGYAFGDRSNGYAVYLGGHSYASCGKATGTTVDPEPHIHTFSFEFVKDISTEVFTLRVKYNGGQTSEISFTKADLGELVGGATGSLHFDLTTASVNKNKINEITFENVGIAALNIESITFLWSGGAGDQKLKKIVDTKTDDTLYDKPEVLSGVELAITGASIPAHDPTVSLGGCTNNDSCSATSIGAVRYVLNTLFNIKYQATNTEYVRSAAIVSHPYLYQGTFEYPSYKGHFRRYDVTQTSKTSAYDTAVGHIAYALENNTSTSARQVFTSKQNADGTWSKVPFDPLNIATLRVPLNITPANGDDTDENKVIHRIRGKTYKSSTGTYVETANKLGGIMHSAPAIIGAKSRVGNSRSEIAYVGDLYGMLHAIETSTGTEKWAYIPKNLLGKLKNDRTDPNAVQDFASVDASPAAKDLYFDHDNNGTQEWRTILACAEGFGGNSIFVLDVTDPNAWSVMWEATDTAAPGGGMGHAYAVAIDKIKWPVHDVSDFDHDGDVTEIIDYEMKWVVFVASGYAMIADNHGGINVFAFDLKTGAKLWHFSAEYADSVNDIPGAVTVYDSDGDSFADRVYVGDMNGRLWELNALDGSNPNGTQTGGADAGKQIPLFNAGVGKPISVSPSIITKNDHTILVFGTGGANWASDTGTYAVYAVDATTKQSTPSYANGSGTLLWQHNLAVGEKVWSTPTIASGQIYVVTSFGGMESSDPGQDVAVSGQTGNLHSLSLASGALAWSMNNIGKVRGSLYVDRQHAYLTTVDNQVLQIGGEDFTAGTGNRVILRSWKQF